MKEMAFHVEGEIAGRTLRIESGKLAEQANGAVTVRFGDTILLVAACVSPEPRPGVDFLPLTIDYEERMYSAGKIPGGYIKREGRPSQDAVLAARLTDRPLRPLFPKGFRNDVQVIATVLSTDQENDPDVLSIIGASAALGISEIPFAGPVSAARVGYINGEYVAYPTSTQLQESKIDLVVAGTRDAVVMVEAGASEMSEEIMLGAILFGQDINRQVIDLQERMIADIGKEKMVFAPLPAKEDLVNQMNEIVGDRLDSAIYTKDKTEREGNLRALETELVEKLAEAFGADEVQKALESKMKAAVRAGILERGIRPDGRTLTEIRPIWCEVGVLPRTHGSGLFTRGQTQVLTIATLGSVGDVQIIDGIGTEESKRFMHHYNFAPFSVGEVRRMGSPGRREIGHGALAERAVLPVIPTKEEFPYTIRLVSEVLSSNGSTSMGSVCGSILALMDAGVPIKAPVAGAAMGLISGEDGKFAILTDIQGLEDALGDMDFKVAGTAAGVTALQMDIKIKGLTNEVLRQALDQAHEARMFILGRMQETIEVARPELSRYAPRIIKLQIHPDKIRTIIGPGGKMIRSIIEETKVTIDIEDDGTVLIGSNNEEASAKAIRIIEGLTREVEVGVIYLGKVTRIMPFGAFVEILPGKEGLVHISELADYRVPSVEDVVQVGDEIMVKVTEIDRMGRVNLSRKAVLLEESGRSGEGEGSSEGGGGFQPRPESRGPRPGPRPERRDDRPGGPRGNSERRW